ncbi:plant UBX domain-containing protein 8-like [Euphorbia lathyris]|uniref:plant UBX domain-containing protein 8-like n=1 Tax=Euphorbia lathyris TaxID=212925 RepID=UPI003313951E
MATPTREAIDTFMRITGASESVAVRKLEEYGGNLDGAINSHFIEDDRQFPTVSPRSGATASPRYDFSDTSSQRQSRPRGILPLLSAARSFKPSLLLDPSYRRNLFNQIGASVSSSHDPRPPPYVQPGELNYGYGQPYHSGPRPVEEADRNSSSHHRQFDEDVLRTHEDQSDIEEQIIQHAIEASKQEDSSSIPQRQLHQEDDELVHAISLSLKTAEQENALREHMAVEDQRKLMVRNLAGRAEKSKDGRFQPGSSSSQGGAEDLQEESLWGSISPTELDEAILLETALFGENHVGTSLQHSPHLKSTSDQGPRPQQVSNHRSPSLTNQRLLREQQDNEYVASLLAEREKEKSASKKPETSDCKKGEAPKKMLDEKELERLFTSKEVSVPQEPAMGDENAVTLLVRLPDGNRCSRRFLKSDKLKSLFDFIDAGRVVEPQTYKLVRPYPRCTFSTSDGSLSLNEVGLTNKQEALFLEMI